jgi:hypothetical protein
MRVSGCRANSREQPWVPTLTAGTVHIGVLCKLHAGGAEELVSFEITSLTSACI